MFSREDERHIKSVNKTNHAFLETTLKKSRENESFVVILCVHNLEHRFISHKNTCFVNCFLEIIQFVFVISMHHLLRLSERCEKGQLQASEKTSLGQF